MKFRSKKSQGGHVPSPEGETAFPDMNYYALMGELAEEYRGTTRVMFQRSNAISMRAGKPLEILVMGHLRNYEQVNEKLHEQRILRDSVRFRSMWTDFHDGVYANDLPVRQFNNFSPLCADEITRVVHGEGVKLRHFKTASDGTNLQIDMLRADGTMIMSQRWDIEKREKRQYSFILCNDIGQPVKEFHSISEYRTFWLDSVIGEKPAVLFSDSFGVAGLTHQYRRPNVITVQTFHNAHLEFGKTGALNYTQERYLPFLKNIDNFDAVVFLTNRQLSDINRLMGEAPHRWVIPNSRNVERISTTLERDRTTGIVLTTLSSNKQPDHAITAISEANKLIEQDISLDVYGSGPLQDALEEQVRELNLQEVRFLGYKPDAAKHFASSSFSLHTSQSEALPLTIIESMAQGCIPVAYDVNYGPSDIITHGVNGFLVNPNNVLGVAKALQKLVGMSDEQLSRMRQAAITRAQDFSDDAIMKIWAQVLNRAVFDKRIPQPLHATNVSVGISARRGAFRFTVKFSCDRDLRNTRVHIVFVGRKVPAIFRVPIKITEISGRTYVGNGIIPVKHLNWFEKGILDASLDIQDDSGRSIQRIHVGDSEQPVSLKDFTLYGTVHGNLSMKKAI